MQTISRQLRLPYTSAQLYALVNDVARYPEFVPWCVSAVVHEQDATSMRASLTMEWQGLRRTIETKNKYIENQSISMNLSHGALKHLKGEWHFIPTNNGCEASLSVQVDFGSRITALLFSKMAGMVLNRVTEAFCARANALYGAKS